MRSKNSWALLLMMLTGIVIGGLLGQLLPSSFLNYGQTSPIVLDLGILALTFGLTIHITVGSIIGMVIAIILYRFL